MKTIINALLTSVSLLISTAGFGAEVPKFSAICSESSARSFSVGTNGDDSWSTEGFASQDAWVFKSKDGKTLEIDGRNVPITTNTEGVIVASEQANTRTSSNVSLYIVHLSLNRILTSWVGGYEDALGQGMVAGLVEFDCDFK